MIRYNIINGYFEWLCDLACGDRYHKQISYRKLLRRLYDIDFKYILPMDANRAEDGLDLRYRYVLENGCDFVSHDLYETGTCNVLEMMVALALRCEETIMDNSRIGNRTGQWFWEMVSNLGLSGMTDDRFNKRLVDDTIVKFMDRKYEPNGKGGLFIIRDWEYDLRDVEIWTQLLWYLDSIT